MLTQFSLEFFEENNLLHLHTINQIRWHVFMYTRTYKLYLSRPTYLRHSHSPQLRSQLQKASLKSKFTETRLLLGLIFYDTAAVCGNPHVIFSLRFNEHLSDLWKPNLAFGWYFSSSLWQARGGLHRGKRFLLGFSLQRCSNSARDEILW